MAICHPRGALTASQGRSSIEDAVQTICQVQYMDIFSLLLEGLGYPQDLSETREGRMLTLHATC